MTTIFCNPSKPEPKLREHLYAGDLMIFSASEATRAVGDHAREMIQAAFGELDPLTAQFHMSVEEYVAIVAPLKPQFIHHPKTKELIRNMLVSVGCDPEKTYFDVPRLRMVTSDAYLTTGVGYAHHAHRDTWYSAPMQQLNWWIPLVDITEENTIAFHPYYWDHPLKNGSRNFNYYEWNGLRKNVAQHVKSDTRVQPKAEEEITYFDPHIRTVCDKDGIVLFAAAQLHTTIPNTSGYTRYSIDFRTVNFDDVVNRIGAPNLDSEPQGTSLRDFMRVSDMERMPEDVVQLYENANPAEGVLIFQPEG